MTVASSRRLGRLARALVLAVLATAALGAASASAADVLILDTTVSNGATSVEAQEVANLGMTAEVASAADWATKTQADFAAYKAVVLGDPTCSVGESYLAPADANKATWSPAITGNVIINGTDPVFHWTLGGTTGAKTLINKSIAFAAAKPGKTGLYVSLSCYYHNAVQNTPVPALSGIGSFTVEGQGGCPADSHIVATHPSLAGLTDADLSNWGCSTHEGFDSWPLEFEVLALSRDIASPFVAPDGSTGAPYIVARGASVISDIKLSPETATNPLGTSHTVTANVTKDGSPQSGKTVTFEVIAGPNTGVTGTGATDASGNASFSYVGNTEGIDTIEARFTDDAGRPQRSNRVTKEWVKQEQPRDTTKPECGISGQGTVGGKKYLDISVKDTGSGLGSVVVTKSDNADTVVPPFTAGSTGALVVRAVKKIQTKTAVIALKVTDVAGNVTDCDPALVDLKIRPRKSRAQMLVKGLLAGERFVRITNGRQGVRKVTLKVNGKRFHARLKAGQARKLDIGSALRPNGGDNVRILVDGKSGSSVSVVISD